MDTKEMNQLLREPLSADQIREGTYFSYITDFYTRNNSAMIWWIWSNALFFLGVMITSGILFFLTNSTKLQILYAVLFLSGVQVIILTKVVYFICVLRNRIIRDMKRLELTMREMQETFTG